MWHVDSLLAYSPSAYRVNSRVSIFYSLRHPRFDVVLFSFNSIVPLYNKAHVMVTTTIQRLQMWKFLFFCHFISCREWENMKQKKLCQLQIQKWNVFLVPVSLFSYFMMLFFYWVKLFEEYFADRKNFCEMLLSLDDALSKSSFKEIKSLGTLK